MLDNVRQLPLPLGSLRYLSITCSRVEWTRSWTIRSFHIHESQKTLECPPGEFEGLTLSEAIDCACALLAQANDRDWHCRETPPRRPL